MRQTLESIEKLFWCLIYGTFTLLTITGILILSYLFITEGGI